MFPFCHGFPIFPWKHSLASCRQRGEGSIQGLGWAQEYRLRPLPQQWGCVPACGIPGGSEPGVTGPPGEHPGRRREPETAGGTLGSTRGGRCRAGAQATAALRGSTSALRGGRPAAGQGGEGEWGELTCGVSRKLCEVWGGDDGKLWLRPAWCLSVARGAPNRPGSHSDKDCGEVHAWRKVYSLGCGRRRRAWRGSVICHGQAKRRSWNSNPAPLGFQISRLV